jgi:hypothetical protein
MAAVCDTTIIAEVDSWDVRAPLLDAEEQLAALSMNEVDAVSPHGSPFEPFCNNYELKIVT